ncbi:MAG: SMC-Scp complex subunit ScpB [Pseudomonadota bacterium]
MDHRRLKSVIEGLIFCNPGPLSLDSIKKALPEASRGEINKTLEELEREYLERNRGFNLIRVQGGYQFRSLPEIAPWIQAPRDLKPWRFSRAALETLAIVAYNQPVTKNQIERIRGVECSSPLKNLIERELVTVIGRGEVLGRPLLYGTTKMFLRMFGLNELGDLPKLPDIEESEL